MSNRPTDIETGKHFGRKQKDILTARRTGRLTSGHTHKIRLYVPLLLKPTNKGNKNSWLVSK